MPIPLQCPQCGKGYRLRDALAGRRVKCRCGAVIAVPRQAGEAAGPPTEHEWDEQYHNELLPPVPPRKAADDKADSVVGPPGASCRLRKPPDPRKDRWRTAVGLLSIAYGSVAALVILYFGLRHWPTGLYSMATQTTLAVLIAMGGVLILKRHQHGPACAGLCCVFLCFFRLWYMLLLLLAALTTGQLIEFLLALILTVALYAIPVLITIWCLKQEMGEKRYPEFP